jgi:hypothetical protein
MVRLLPAATLLLATLASAPACASEQPYYQPGWGGAAPAQAWYRRPAPPPRWGWQAPPPRHGWNAPPPRWAGPPPPPRHWGGPPPRGGDRGWDGPRQTRHEQRRPDHRQRDDRRW